MNISAWRRRAERNGIPGHQNRVATAIGVRPPCRCSTALAVRALAPAHLPRQLQHSTGHPGPPSALGNPEIGATPRSSRSSGPSPRPPATTSRLPAKKRAEPACSPDRTATRRAQVPALGSRPASSRFTRYDRSRAARTPPLRKVRDDRRTGRLVLPSGRQLEDNSASPRCLVRSRRPPAAPSRACKQALDQVQAGDRPFKIESPRPLRSRAFTQRGCSASWRQARAKSRIVAEYFNAPSPGQRTPALDGLSVRSDALPPDAL